MRLPSRLILFLLLITAAACATQPPRFRDQAVAALDRVREEGGERLRPEEYASAYQAFLKGDALVAAEESEEADRYFELTLLKVELLDKWVREETARRQAEAERLAEEQRKAELALKAKQEEERLARARALAAAQKEAAETERRKVKPAHQEPQLVGSYTVKRGESLPLIASHPEVFGDRNLWPLIYRANRDQIRDPRRLWPGQVLRIPRNAGRDDIAEARRYAQERPLR